MRIIITIYKLLLVFSLVIGVLQFKKLSKVLKLVFLFVVCGFLTESSMDILKHYGLRNTMPVGHIYIPVSFIILGLFYIILLKGYVNKKILTGIILSYELLCIINLIFIQKLTEFPNITAAIGALIIIIFSVLLFSKVMLEAKIEKLSREPIIWINTAFLIYYAGNFFYFILFNANVKLSMEYALYLHFFYVGLNLLLYSLIPVAFLILQRE